MFPARSVFTWAVAASALLGSARAGEGPLKVYLLVGQSNMQGQARQETLAGMADDPATRPLYDKIVGTDGKVRVFEDVSVAAFSGGKGGGTEKHGPLTFGFGGDLTGGDRLGPELAFGATLYEHLKGPFLIIKTSWGGKSLSTDFRPPSAGPFTYPEQTAEMLRKRGTLEKDTARRNENAGHYYRLMREHIRSVLADPGKYCKAYDPNKGYEIAGFVWFQGWNDMCDGHTYPQGAKDRYTSYTEVLCHFIRDVRKDLNAPHLPFIIGVMGTGGNPDRPDAFREAMAAPAAMPEFKDRVVAVHTARCFDERLGELVDRSWKWMNKRYDPEGKYAELAGKLLPLQKELNEAKKIKDRRERGAKQQEIQARMRSILYTPDDEEYMKKNKSNKGYHYLGSAKIYSRIGEAFARALTDMENNRRGAR